MCGRFTLTTPDIESLARLVAAEIDPRLLATHAPHYNIAPTAVTVLLRQVGEHRRLEPGVWGLASPWGDERRPGGFINARAETVATLPSFRDAYAQGRVGVLADGFFEWSGPKAQRRPLWFRRRDGATMVLAGISREQIDRDTGEVTRHFAILTTRANATLAPHHDRMPVILPLPGLERWLGPGRPGPDLLLPAPDDLLSTTPVSPRVNSPRHDDPACVEPLVEVA
ncbi:SOS response-associated peptidase [Nannocystis sp.]|uniref:SOS response-associated peptidase n=1 Tax=Nannocystis sp. TaxID=1962667 RepID=UPI0024248B26|nr:SOS response-associated peptidase [Nannocystis sp.]MBK7829262.1 SOS response-associated peptidase [Nannocystis sp.]MBK9752663.1 SOS response-associated peptidase [Nannocystis sp.]